MQTVSEVKSHAGVQGVYSHDSTATGTKMTFAVFVPEHSAGQTLPVLWYLSGLTCTHANVMDKGEYRKAAAELGIIIVAPDTSPRGEGVPDAEGYDFGQGAGFYLDATEAPWREHFKMGAYIENELPALVESEFPVDVSRQGIFGHSMGGHGALTVALRNPKRFKSVSAFAPIASPMHCPWGIKALSGYLGEDRSAWRAYDACALIEDGARVPEILVHQGTRDNFLESELHPNQLVSACENAGIQLRLDYCEGYDHSYFFISSFMDVHLRWHHERLR